jgi:cytochrome c-type biogenesis protein CcsB
MSINSSAFVTLTWPLVASAVLTYAAGLTRKRRLWDLLGTGLAVGALLTVTLALLLRAFEAGHWPLSNAYEFSLALLWSVLATFLLLERMTHIKGLGAFVMGVALLVATYPALLAPDWAREARPLLPALRTSWLQLHVTTGALAYGAFAVACGASLMYLIGGLGSASPDSFPSSSSIEEFSYRALTLGYPWMSLVLITGAVWAQIAWGRYWGWDIKETWSLVTWLLYTLLLHLRAVRGWRGKPIAALTILGFVMVLFTFLGVGWLAHRVGLQSLHLY